MNNHEMNNRPASPSAQPSLSLPDWCYSVLPSSGALIVVERDVRGYGKASESTADPQTNRKLATKYNADMGINPQQEAAMLGGFMFGWDTPAAQITSYNAQGEPIAPSQRTKARAGLTDQSFLTAPGNAFAIYQLKPGDETRDLRFEPLERIAGMNMAVDRANYELVYTAPLPERAGYDAARHLHDLYQTFNIGCPEDYTGHSLSVSDVIALKRDGAVACYFVDRWDFKELPAFLPDPMKSAEMKKAPPTIQERIKAGRDAQRKQPKHQKKAPAKGAEER